MDKRRIREFAYDMQYGQEGNELRRDVVVFLSYLGYLVQQDLGEKDYAWFWRDVFYFILTEGARDAS